MCPNPVASGATNGGASGIDATKARNCSTRPVAAGRCEERSRSASAGGPRRAPRRTAAVGEVGPGRVERGPGHHPAGELLLGDVAQVLTALGRIAPKESTENSVAVLSSKKPVDVGLSNVGGRSATSVAVAERRCDRPARARAPGRAVVGHHVLMRSAPSAVRRQPRLRGELHDRLQVPGVVGVVVGEPDPPSSLGSMADRERVDEAGASVPRPVSIEHRLLGRAARTSSPAACPRPVRRDGSAARDVLAHAVRLDPLVPPSSRASPDHG